HVSTTPDWLKEYPMPATHSPGSNGATGSTIRSDAEISDATASWSDVTLQDVFDAQVRIMPHLRRTPMLSSNTLSEMTGTNLSLKAEVFQKTGSFKTRGALNAALQLTPEQREGGLVTMSAGNHGQGLA